MPVPPATYGSYLQLDRILDAQQRRSADHNELLFIIQHQTSELWMKLMLHELGAARDRLRADDLQPAFKMLARVSRIMEQLVHAWDVLATMTPSEYSAMRPHLGTSSGFQSWQYRLIEFLLGNRRRGPLEAHVGAAITATLEAALREPSLYDVALALLVRRGLLRQPTRRSQPTRSPANGPATPKGPSRPPGSSSIAIPIDTGTSTSSQRN